jgi:hypothetical protein
MKQDERIRRPKPERTGPIRGGTFSLFGAPEAPSPDDSRTDGGVPADPVARGVDLGYRVVDDYIRQGQNAARRIAQRSYGPEALVNDVQELTAGLMQYGAEVMDLLMQLLGQAAVGQATRPSSNPAPLGEEPAWSAGPEGGPSAAPRVIVAVESPYATEVSVDLDAGAGRSLVIQDLQNPRGGPPLTGAVLEGGERPRLGVRVPPGQPPGTYCGLVLDAETILPAGNVVVRVLPPQAPSDEQP